jgi:hypothetical protein
VLGLSVLPDNTMPDKITYHSFFWQKGVVTDLGALPGTP